MSATNLEDTMTNVTDDPETRKIELRLIWLILLALAVIAIFAWLPNVLAPKPAVQIETGGASVSIGQGGISVRTTDPAE